MRISDWSSDVCSSDLAATVPEIIDQYLALALRFGGRRDKAVRAVGGHRIGDALRERLHDIPYGVRLQRGHHVQSLAARCLEEGGRSKLFQPLAHLLRRVDHLLPLDAEAGVQHTEQPARLFHTT